MFANTKRLSYISPLRLKSGNKEFDEKISKLLKYINLEIEDLLDNNGNLSIKASEKMKDLLDYKGNLTCNRVDYFINTLGLEQKVFKEVRRVLEPLRETFSIWNEIISSLRETTNLIEAKEVIEYYNNELKLRGQKVIINTYILNLLLTKCDNSKETKEVIDEYGEGVKIDKNILNSLLSKCTNNKDIIKVIDKYGENIKFDIIIMITILRVVLRDPEITKNDIKQVLISINQIESELTEKNVEQIQFVFAASKKWSDFIVSTIEKYQLSKLYFLHQRKLS